MKVSHRVMTLFLLALVGMISITAVSMMSLRQDEDVFREIGERTMPKTEFLLRLRGDIHNLIRRGHSVAARQDLDFETQKTELQPILQDTRKALADAVEHLRRVEELPRSPRGEAMWRDFAAQWNEWTQADRARIAALEEALAHPSPQAFASLFERVKKGNLERSKQSARMQEKLDEIIALQDDLSAEGIASALHGTARDSVIMVVIIVVSVLVLGAFTFSIMRSAIRPLARASGQVGQVAEKLDLTVRLDNAAHDEIGEMCRAFDYMMGKLQAAFRSIREQVDAYGEAVASVSAAAGEVAQGSASQSNSASAMAASIEQMSVSINTVSNSSAEARAMAQEAGTISEQGEQIIDRTRDEIAAISRIVADASRVIETLGEESRQITNVVSVIKEVADQTNLLALNAAIEAARAGEQGRGFAVVADEVRKLAERTAQSTVDISVMAEKIQGAAGEAVSEMSKVVAQVDSGQTLASEAGERMQSIRAQASKVSGAVADISDALHEQSQASHDVARHVESIAQMTDENNAAADRAAANARQLEELAREVNATLACFKV